MNCSRPIRRSSMKDSSKRPSSERNGNCLFRALPGRDGTTICRCKGSTQVMATVKIMKSKIHTSCAVKSKLQIFLYIYLTSHFIYCRHREQTYSVILLFTLHDHRRRASIVPNVTQTWSLIRPF